MSEEYSLELLHNTLVSDPSLVVDGDAYNIEYTAIGADDRPLKLSQVMALHAEGKQCLVSRIVTPVEGKKRGIIGAVTNIGNTVACYAIDQKTREIWIHDKVETCTCPTHAALKDEGGEG